MILMKRFELDVPCRLENRDYGVLGVTMPSSENDVSVYTVLAKGIRHG